jgi:hypothetical protein
VKDNEASIGRSKIAAITFSEVSRLGPPLFRWTSLSLVHTMICELPSSGIKPMNNVSKFRSAPSTKSGIKLVSNP